MEMEIAIEGPDPPIRELQRRLRPLFPMAEIRMGLSGINEKKTGLVLVEEEKRLDNTLRDLSREVRKVERDFALENRLEFRVRNLAYSEPATDDLSFQQPFEPVPSIRIYPWRRGMQRPQDPLAILIDPTKAFGSGKHPSTRLCLEFLTKTERGRSSRLDGKRVLDFGCGTGLLAITAAKFGAASVLGVEIDADSAQTARMNVVLNAMNERIDIKTGSWEVVEGRYDVILMNVVPSVLLRTGSHLPEHMNRKGQIILSGFGRNQLDEVTRFLDRLGLMKMDIGHLEGWSALWVERKRQR